MPSSLWGLSRKIQSDVSRGVLSSEGSTELDIQMDFTGVFFTGCWFPARDLAGVVDYNVC